MSNCNFDKELHIKYQQALDNSQYHMNNLNDIDEKIEIHGDYKNTNFTSLNSLGVNGDTEFSECVFDNIDIFVRRNSKITFYNSVVKGQLKVLFNDNSSSSCVEIDACIISSYVASCNIKSLSINLSTIKRLYLNSCTFATLGIYGNVIDYLVIQNLYFDNKFTFNIEQIRNLKKLVKEMKQNNKENGYDGLAIHGLVDTMEFLRKNSDVQKNIEKSIQVVYFQRYFSQQSFWVRMSIK